MPDKLQFMREMARVVKPGGRIILVTWCVRELGPGESDYTPDEKARRMLIGRPRDGAHGWAARSSADDV
jgi:hypothetical protein